MTLAKALTPAQLTPSVPDDQLTFDDTSQLTSETESVAGQERALGALDFGLSLPGKGYNLFVLGEVGSGRATAIRRRLAQLAEQQLPPNDWCYVTNFEHPDSPVAIDLPAGKAPQFAKRIRDLIEEWKETIPLAFDSEKYETARSLITDSHDEENEANFNALRQKARFHGLAVKRATSGFSLVPLTESGEPMQEDEFTELPEEQQKAIKLRQEEMWVYVSAFLRQIRSFEKDVKNRVKLLDGETVDQVLELALAELRGEYREHPRIVAYLRSLQNHIVDSRELFKPAQEPAPSPRALMGMVQGNKAEPTFARYDVNVFISHTDCRHAPVVYEHNPTYYNLFGAVEYRSQLGTLVTDASMIKPGALHRANGGYLIVQAQDLFRDFMTWDSLKRALRNEELRIEELGKQFSLIATAGVRPEPIPLKIKLVLVGTPHLYYLLSRWDPEFTRFFKVKSDFDMEIPRTESNLRHLAIRTGRHCQDKGLPHFGRDAVIALAEALSRLADHQEKLSARFMDFSDLAAEAGHWCRQGGKTLVDREDVERALAERVFRSNRIEQKINELIGEGTFLIDVDGEKVGQINGLAVLDMGDYRFGKPSRITAQTYLGKQGLLNIEREARLSGQLHDKGVLILRGFFLGRYGQQLVPAFGASVTFEQEYAAVDGDSASSTELYALLSSLSGCAIRQGIAVTGSVSQMGEVQPIGGVNEKIEGFFKVCRAFGLTGRQGVMIPAANERHLILSPEVRQAVGDGAFHVWSVRTVDEGIALLTGLPAGEADANGQYPEGSVNRRVMDRLKLFDERLQNSGRDFDGEGRKSDREDAHEEKPDPHPKLPDDTV